MLGPDKYTFYDMRHAPALVLAPQGLTVSLKSGFASVTFHAHAGYWKGLNIA